MYSLGIDVGSSAVKACLYRVAPGAAPEELARAAAFRPLRVPRPGWVEQDADEVVAAVLEVLASVLEQAGQPRPLVLGLATAMHSLLVLDRQGRPTGPALTWADQRSARQAERLRTLFPGPSLAVRTGTPLAAMAWPARLLWLKEQAPYLLDPSHRLASLKEYVVSRLAGLPPGRNFMDLSSASATGMYNILEGSWDGELLQLVGLSAEQLPEVLPTTFILPASGLGALLPPDSRLVLGGGDGPLSNLGVGALGPEVAALSLGTSGALRVARRGPARQGQGGTFCYHLVEEIWVVGGALSNGGVVLEWLGRGLGLSLEALLEEAAAVPWGAGGVVALPYLAGERTPHWDARARGVVFGLGLHHTRGHVVRAFLEGVAFAFREVLEALPEGPVPLQEIRATGGGLRSSLWARILADVLGLPLILAGPVEGACLGAALLAAWAVGWLDPLPAIAARLKTGPRYIPDARAAEVYQERYRVYRQLYPLLAGLMHLCTEGEEEPAAREG